MSFLRCRVGEVDVLIVGFSIEGGRCRWGIERMFRGRRGEF